MIQKLINSENSIRSSFCCQLSSCKTKTKQVYINTSDFSLTSLSAFLYTHTHNFETTHNLILKGCVVGCQDGKS